MNRFAIVPLGMLPVLLLTSALAAATPGGEAGQDPVRTFQLRYRSDRPVEAAQESLGFLSRIVPGLEGISAKYAMADILMDQGRTEDAVKILRPLSEVRTPDAYFKASVLLRLGVCHMRLGSYTTAAQYYAATAQAGLRALTPEALLGLAVATLAAGDLEKTLLHFQEVTALYPAYAVHPRFMLPMGLIQWEVRRFEGALSYFARDDRNPVSLYFAGICQRELRRAPEATGMFRRIMQEHPDSPWAPRAHFELGETFYRQGDFLLAAQTFGDVQQARYSERWDSLAVYRLACCDIRTNKLKSAEERLWTLNRRELDPAMTANVTYLLTETLAGQDKIGKIVALLEAVPAKKRTPETTYRLIWARAARGDYPKAAALATQFLKTIDDQELAPRTLLLQGHIFSRMGRDPEALANFQLVAEHFPDTPYAPKAVELAAASFFRAGEYKVITTQLNSLWKTIPGLMQKQYPESLYWMGHANLKLRDGAGAHRQFQAFLNAAPPQHRWAAEALRANALAIAMDKSHHEALPVLQRAYQTAREMGDKALMAQLSLDMGHMSFNARKYDDAVTFYRQFVAVDAKHPEAPTAVFQQAVALHRGEYYNDAIATWDRFAATYPKDPRSPEALFRAARTRFELGKYEEAVGGYERLVRNYPDSTFARDAQLQIGQAHFNSGDYVKAIEAYGEFQARYPKDPETAEVDKYLQLAYFKAGKSPDEIAQLTKGKVKSPLLADYYWEEGAKAYNAKDYDKALDLFQKLLYEFPTAGVAPQAAFYRAESLFLKENYADAAGAYEGFLQGYPDDPQRGTALFHLGVCYFNGNEYAKSAEAFEAYAQANSGDPLARTARLNIAISHARTGDVEKTKQAYLEYAGLYPSAPDLGAAYVQLGQFLEKAGQEPRAIEAYGRVPKDRPEFAQALYLKARLHRTLSEPVGERKAYEALRGVLPKNDPYRVAGVLALADVYVTANDADRAIGAYEDVARNADDEPSRNLARQQVEAIRKALEQAGSGSPR